MKRERSNFWIAWFFLLTLIVIGASSCRVTRERCQELYPPQVKDSIITVTHDSIICDLDTVYFPASDIMLDFDIPELPKDYQYHKSVTKNNLTSTVSIANGKISFDCKADSLQKITEHQSHVITVLTKHLSENIQEVIIYRDRFIDQLCRWIAGLSLGTLLILMARKKLSVRKE